MFDDKDPNPVSTRDEEVAELLDRVQRLEDAVAALQDTQPLEERIYERLHKTPQTKAPASQEAATREAATPPPPSIEQPDPTSGWLLLEYVADLGMIGRMFIDMNYHVTWSTRLTVLILMPIILVSGWFFSLLGGIIDKILVIFLAFYVFKTLTRELQRYRRHLARRPAAYEQLYPH